MIAEQPPRCDHGQAAAWLRSSPRPATPTGKPPRRHLARLLAAWLAAPAGLLAAAADARAETIGPEATARGVTVMTRPRPDYDAGGIRFPGFRLDGALEAGGGYDSNMLPGQGPQRRGGFLDETLSATATSSWTRHGLGLSATQSTRQYPQDSDLNWTDWGVGAEGRYDIGRASWLRLRYEHLRSHLDVDNFDLQEGTATRVPVPYDTDIVQLSGSAAFNRLELGAAIEYRALRYEDVTVDGQRDEVSVNDHRMIQGDITADYTLLPGRALLGRLRLQDIAYAQSEQRGRDSKTWEAQGGFRYDVTGLLQARVLVGYRSRDYEQPGLKSLSGPAFEGSLTFIPSQLATVTVGVQRTIEESIRQTSVSYTRTAARLRLDYELQRNLIVSGELRAERRKYPAGGGTVSDAVALVEARLLLTRNLALVASYQHTERLEAPNGIQEYGRDQVMLRLRFAL